MFAPRIVQNRIDVANHVLRKQLKNPKFELTYNSIADVKYSNQYFNQLKGEGGNFRRALTRDESEWIWNERTLCAIDIRYWFTRYHWIKDIYEKVIRFCPNIAQEIVLDVLAELEEKGVAQFLQSLKARQVGITTIAQAIILYLIIFYQHKNAIVGSSDPRKSAEMVEKFFLSYDRQPFWMKPSIGNFKTGEWYKFDNNSNLWVQHGTQFTDMGRGTTPSCAHLSECADYDKPERLIDAGLLKSLHETPQAFFVAESTANSDTGWWPETWEDNVKYYESGEAKMYPFFLPWFVARDLYPTKTWLASHKWNEVKDTWSPSEMTVNHATNCENYVKSNALLSKHLGTEWKMPIEQKFYYEREYERHKRKKILHIWYSEMPASAQEAFQSPKMSIFDAELRANYRNAIKLPLAVYGIRSEHIPKNFWPSASETDHDKKILKITADWTHSFQPFEFHLVPLKFQGYSNYNPINKLFIWEWPADGNVYAYGADTSDGLGEERSDNGCLNVLRKGDYNRCDAQVAEFVTPDFSGFELWPFTLLVGTLFSVKVRGKLTQAFLVPEINREGGRDLVKAMQVRGWKASAIYKQISRSSVRRGSPQVSFGMNLNEVTRPDVVNLGISSLKNEWLEINSPWFISEMGTFIKHENGKLASAKGKKDDRLMSTWEAFYSFYGSGERDSDRTPMVERERAMSEEVLYPVYDGGEQVYGKSSEYLSKLVGG